MQSLEGLSKLRSTSAVSDSSTLVMVQNSLIAAKAEPDLIKKRVMYEGLYQTFKQEALKGPLSAEMQTQLFTMFENYAEGTCYGQENTHANDDEEGFRKSACLMELSVMLQLHALGLTDVKADWSTSQTLEQLCESLHFEKGQKGLYFDTFFQRQYEPSSLCSAAKQKGLREVLTKTLIRLCFSYQNIEAYTQPVNATLCGIHCGMNKLTEVLIGDETQEVVTQAQLETLEDFRYNRCRFLAGLIKPGSVDEQVASYDSVLELTQKVHKDNPIKLNSRIAQIENMRGILLSRTKIPENLVKAEHHFRNAFALRLPLLGKCESAKENFDQLFLLSNVRIALINYCLVHGNLDEAADHANALKAFLSLLEQQNNNHCYREGYVEAIKKVDDAVKAKTD